VSLAFLIPAALAALAALLLPLLIHLARRSEQRPTAFAALRWLRQKPKPRHRIRFDEWPLLIVRLLLIALMALLLARPVLHGGEAHTPYVAVAPGIDPAPARGVSARARVHWLAPGFPSIDAAPGMTNASLASLLRELDATLPDDVKLTVFVPQRIDHADGRRIALSREVDWRIVPVAPPTDAMRKAVPPPAMVVRHATERAAATRYLRAAALAWQPPDSGAKVDVASIEQPLSPNTKRLAWISAGSVPGNIREWARSGGTLLLDVDAKIEDAPAWTPLWRDEAGDALVEGAAYGRGRVLRFTRSLAPQAMPQLLDPTFPQQLRAALEPPAAAPSRVAAAEYKPLTGGPTFAIAPRDLQPWLALLIALVFLLERWLATSSRRAVAP